MKIKPKGKEIHSAILKSGNNQKKFANELGISPVHLNRIIKEKINPSSEMTEKIRTKLNREFDELFEIVE